MGRKRRHDPTIPAHIDQARLPAGIYWDKSGRGRWYVREMADGRKKARTVARASARLSDLHKIAEGIQRVDSRSLDHLMELFHASERFGKLSAATKRDHEYCRDVVSTFRTKLGPLGRFDASRIDRVLVQRILDKMADTPSKAAHVKQYLHKLYRWSMNRGHVPAGDNPAKGVETAKQRKRGRLPDDVTFRKVLAFARERGAYIPHTLGSCPPYLWAVMDLAYLCRLRGIEVLTLTDAHETGAGIQTNRRKGSRDNVVRWSPRLRAAWDALVAIRDEAWRGKPIPMRAEDRVLCVAQDGSPLRKSSLDSAWQRIIHAAMTEGVIAPEQRFSLHDLKRKGVTDTPGTRGEKQLASGHKSEAMLDVYDKSLPVVDPAGRE